MQASGGKSDRRKTMAMLLTNARRNAGIDRDTCARLLQISRREYDAYEAGSAELCMPQLEILSRMFCIPVTYFWSEEASADGPSTLPKIPNLLNVRRRMIGVLLRQARLAAGKSVGECAEQLAVDTEEIANYEYGRADIPVSSLESLAEFLHVPLTYFTEQELVSTSDKTEQMMEALEQLPPDVRDFVLRPTNVMYVRLAMLLSDLPTETLRQLGEGLLDITL